jgi:HK97 family phage major capsid protein
MAVDGITQADAEALFDEALAGELINALPKKSAALQGLTVVPMGTKTARIPVLSALPTAAFLNASQAVKPQSEAAWANKLLTAEEIAVIVPIDENVIADASIDVVQRTIDLIVQEFGRVLDAAVFFGTGAPTTFPVGGLFAAAAKVEGSGNPGDDMNSLFSAVEEIGNDVTDVFASRSLRSTLRGMKDGNGSSIYVPTEGNPNVGSIYGVPAAYPLGWDKTKADAIAVDDSCAIIGLRSDVKTKILTEASLTGFGNLAERDSIAIRAVMRVGFTLANPASLENPTGVLPIAALTPKAP